ncbi:imidazolonepropionase-like domain-containing protein [Micromonospora wenchangensis]|uniref:imidazolonepropionase-like domain-containing protein n=1 Tax=Micromonospora wenchangensis TaxID=1185415 RepID=UPI0037F390A6
MRTLHTAPLLRLTRDDGPPPDRPAPGDGGPLSGWAVLVDGDRIEAVGPVGELTQAYPAVRVRRWPGTLGPALVHDGPLPPAASPRERVHALLRVGVGAVLAAHLADPALRAAVARNDVVVLDSARPPALTVGGRADLAVFADDSRCLATVVAGRLVHRRT